MYYCLLFMVSIYCILVIPNPCDYFYMPRFFALLAISLTAGFIYFRKASLAGFKYCYSLFVFLLLLTISCYLGLDPTNSWLASVRWTGLSTYFFCAILFFVAAATQRKMEIIKVALFTAAIVSALAILQWFGINLVPHEEFREEMITISTMGNRNFVGSYLVFLLPAAVLFWLQEKKPVWLAVTTILFAGLIVSLTRGAWLTFILILLYFLFETFKGKFSRKAMAALCITITVVFLFLLPSRDGLIIGRAGSIPGEINAGLQKEDGAGAGRMFIWKESLKLFPRYWAFGMGPENLIYGHIVLHKYGTVVDKAHNIYIEMLVTTGIFAFIAFLYFLATVIKIPENAEEEILFLMIITYLIQGLFSFEIIMIMPIFWIVLGFSYGNRQVKRYQVSVQEKSI